MIERSNPDTVHATAGYSHVTISEAGRVAHLAGQCPLDVTGDVVRSVVYIVSSVSPVLGEVWRLLTTQLSPRRSPRPAPSSV